jgi:predicted nucleic acid-binding protein
MNFEDLPVRANLFDASALVKVFSNEHSSSEIRTFFHNYSPTKYTTAFCLYEALNGLKSKWLHRGQMTQVQYAEQSLRLVTWYRACDHHGMDVELTEPEVFARVMDRVNRASIDISDSFQIESVRSGYFSFLARESATLLVTADNRLAQVARDEGLKAWYFPSEPFPA